MILSNFTNENDFVILKKIILYLVSFKFILN
jgi:hypothetical protein